MSLLPLCILLAFLITVLAVGLRHSLSIRNLRDYVLSPGFFSVAGLAFSIIATEIGSGSILGTLEKVHQHSMIYCYGLLGLGYQMMLTSILAPRVYRLGRKLSVGDIISDAYGDTARICTALFWLMFCTGIVAAQVAALGQLLSLLLPTSTEFNMVAGALVVMIYSGYCGIRAVVATDGIQAFVMLAGVTLLIGFGVEVIGGYGTLVQSVSVEKLIGHGDLGIAGAVSLFLSFALGDMLIPPVVQRILMARNSRQASVAFTLSALFIFPMVIGFGFLGLVGYVLAPSIVAGESFSFMLALLPDIGKSLVICGILAAVMSSADSYLNTAGVALSHDLLNTLVPRPISDRRRLFLARLATLLVGAVAVFLSLSGDHIMDLMLTAFRFWGPTVAVPLLVALYVRNTTSVQFFLPCCTGLSTVIAWEMLDVSNTLGLSSLIAGMAANALTCTVLVLFLRQGETGLYRS